MPKVPKTATISNKISNILGMIDLTTIKMPKILSTVEYDKY